MNLIESNKPTNLSNQGDEDVEYEQPRKEKCEICKENECKTRIF